MRQVLQSYRSGELWLAQLPVPALRGGGAIVQTAESLVSAGTERMIIELAKKSLLGKARARPDLVRKIIRKIKTEGLSQTVEKVFSKLDTPIPLGYSCAGTIVELGNGVDGFKVGDRVACAGAGYATHADYNFVPKNLLARIPDGVSFEDAAFTTVGAIAMQGVRQADVRLGERVVVIGLGLLGLLTVQLLKASGCRVLGSDPDGGRCDLARTLGADDAVMSDLIEAAGAFTDGQGADTVVITAATSSNGPVEQAAEICRQRGRVVVVGMVGMNIPRDSFYKKELDLRLSMSCGPGRYDASYEEGGHDYPFGYVRWTEQRNMTSFLDLIAAGRVTPGKLITHRFDVIDALSAYELLETNSQPSLGIVINYPTPTDAKPERVVELRKTRGDSRLGIGFIGAGNFAKGVLLPKLKKIAPDAELVGICTASGMNAHGTAEKHDFAYATTDHLKLLADPKVNTVFVVTRHDSHARFATQALAAGKHVFVEKPLCMRPEELELYETALSQTRGQLLMVGFNRRFSPHAIAVKEAFVARRTPMVVTCRVNAGAVPPEAWTQNDEVGGGRIIGEMCHFVDLCGFLIGSDAVSVHADCVRSDDVRIKGADSTIVTIRYADGSLASIQYVAIGSPDLPKERIEIFADGASAVIDDFVRTSFFGMPRRTLKTTQDKGIEAELKAFTAAIRDGGAAPIPLDSILATTRLTFQIHESLNRGVAVEAQSSSESQEIECLSSEQFEPHDTCAPARS